MLQEARIQRVLQRAAAPAFRRSGKPVMLRSVAAVQRGEGGGSAGAGRGGAGEQQQGGIGSDDDEELAVFLALVDASIQE